MKTSLKHIATIQTGVYGKTVSQGEIVYLQAKHFDESGKLHSTPHPDLRPDSITEKHMLKPGDVLFAANLRYIQEILGHRSSKTTEIYTHVSTKSIQRIVSPFDYL